MINYILKRVVLMIVTLWFILTITFTAMFFMPGDPYSDSDKVGAEVIEQRDEANGFNRPFLVQYADYFTNITGLEGLIKTNSDWEPSEDGIFGFYYGYSFSLNDDVSDKIQKSFPLTLTLGISSVIVGVLVGIFLGLIASLKKNSFADYFATFIAVAGVSFPSFILAAYMQYFLAVKIPIFPTAYQTNNPMSMFLPITALSVFAIAQVSRVTRTEMIEILNSNYITLARAKGLKKNKVILGHAFRNSLVSILTIVGPITVSLTTGSLVIESIFGIPGIGDYVVNGVLSNDMFLVLGTTMIIALEILVMYLIVDILYLFVDPRITLGGK